ncbi:hypothetical protein EVAR_98956_1 [Eumeta japonica]|uniref:Uncharacterized protein n=1 Tax=Eumeta variegata TaxID=151549 RepID=A0A4C1YR93_EUMVA|nr:hypothetical protein EVAR_98956_1 [Eumeta japonica]
MSRRALKPGNSTVAVFFDVAKAFDRVWHAANRHFTFRHEHSSTRRRIRAGVPQGSTSSLLYVLRVHKRYSDRRRLASNSRYSRTIPLALLRVGIQARFTLLPSRRPLLSQVNGSEWRIEVNPDKSAAIQFQIMERFWHQTKTSVQQNLEMLKLPCPLGHLSDDAVSYVQLKREGNLCTIKAKICPEHKVHAKLYGVSLVVDEQEETVKSVECHDCVASQGGCKHAMAFLIVIFSDADINNVEEETREQHKSKLWYELRYGRVTASRAYEFSRCKTSDGTLMAVIMGGKIPDTTAMKRGRILEDEVRKTISSVVQWLSRHTATQSDPGSIPGQVKMENDLFQIDRGLGCLSILVYIKITCHIVCPRWTLNY